MQQSETLLYKIETIGKERKLNLTTHRKLILEILIENNRAMTAYELLDILQQRSTTAKPPTVYRGVEYLIEHGLIHRIESLNRYILCPHFTQPTHSAILFICDNCSSIIEKHSDIIERNIRKKAKNEGFGVTRSVIELRGRCQTCENPQP